MRTRWLILLSLLAVAVPSVAPAQAHYTFTSIADAADYGGYFEPTTITNWDGVLFAPALLTGGEGALLWRGSVLTTIAKAGDVMPGGGVMGYTFSPLQMNDNGDVALVVTRDFLDFPSPAGFNAGVYRYNRHTGIVPVLIPGTPAPSGGTFWGSYYVISINNRGDIYSSGMICTTATLSYSTQACPDGSNSMLTLGTYQADARGTITSLVVPGDPAPGGSYFDFSHSPVANARGDVAFLGHVFSDPCVVANEPPYCDSSIFFKRRHPEAIVPIARVGSPSPVSGRTYGAPIGPALNSGGDVAFEADISLAHDYSEASVFLYTHGRTIVIAKHGDALPGGGTFAKGGPVAGSVAINNAGEVVFTATLTDGTQGVYLWRHGRLSLVAKTGTQTGAGIIADVDDFGFGQASTQVAINDVGQVLFAAHFQDGGGAMLVATAH